MSGPRVTREHRQAALNACDWEVGGCAVDSWADVGGDVFVIEGRDGRSDYTVNMCTENAVALEFAAQEHRFVAELRSLLARSEFIGPVDYVQADSIRNLIVHLGGEDV